ncbi:chemotaxis protein CheW [Isoalcanivorax beigongshangi]|uniref:Chemotaxis protein CheW n=1 Tax=Isoalcanivorax beigongshangi TaxID=3238810 RepID=A0ABV4AGG1_9GAMM
MSDLPRDIPSLLVPMRERPWLVPETLLAEVLPLRHPERPGRGRDWLLGWIRWRDEELPLVSFERLNQTGPVVVGEGARIGVLRGLGGVLPHYAMVFQGEPQPLTVAPTALQDTGSGRGPMEAHRVQVAGESAVVPDLDALETVLAGLYAEA